MPRSQSRRRLTFRVRRGRSAVPGPLPDPDEIAARVCADLVEDLPEEDLGEDPSEALELYVPGSKPRCEEAEYLDLVEEAVDRIARGPERGG